ncbi:MAG TPA: CGNR zinc finger domain-containing protein [Pseudonocardia sp.]|jgi:predicted RNA-binding Zn ribbon-like protein|uniref:CGNR zinc finger domain-containing protein n=1 Tax=Pseudonocardia sp. TaxID=60912 RepID=UPI002B4AF96A|nr:CGNR zinc finger domain-containing protein [Pseudonocardia sp.]HLU54124.1 CGNR zinc finger domain-containing protein [Pseudonocardia sp.]
MSKAHAPAPLDLVQDLVNTWSGRLSGGGDEHLASPADLARWCRAHGVAVADDAVTADDLALARTVREGLRAALARHNDAVQPADAEALQRLDEAAPALGLRVSLAGDSPELLPRDGSPARRLLASALAAVVPAARDRTWQRLKVCREPRCRAAFYDASRNASGVWCSMSACGAAAKQRAFVERRRARRAAGKAAAAS